MRSSTHVGIGLGLIGVVMAGSLAGARAGLSARRQPIAHGRVNAAQDAPAAGAPRLQPAVATLIKAATAEYQKMKSYQHTAELVIKSDREDVPKDSSFTLALERPNRFCYRNEDADGTTAAICDGKLFINLKEQQYTRTLAPASYKDINIVDDVTFEPIATYIVALMLQGDALADKEVRAALQNAAAPIAVTEQGKKYDTISIQLEENSPPTVLYFDAETHLLHKAVTKSDALNIRITEIIENVRINAAILPSVFRFTPPKGALLLTRRDRPAGRHLSYFDPLPHLARL
jgi:outer membrane lipoprotein-sorting protein